MQRRRPVLVPRGATYTRLRDLPLYRRGLRRGFGWGTFNAALWVCLYVGGGLAYRWWISP